MMKNSEFDSILSSVLEEVESEQEANDEFLYKQFLESNTQDDYKLDEDFRSKLIQLAQMNGERDKSRNQSSKGIFVPRWAATVACIVMSTMFFVMVVQAAGVDLLQLFSTTTHTEIKISHEMNQKYLNKLEEAWGTVYFPQYIPPGYVLVDITEKSLYITTEFRKGNESLSITQFKTAENATSFIDTESSDYETITLENSTGFLSQKNGLSLFYYYKNQEAFLIRGTINRREILMLAESLM